MKPYADRIAIPVQTAETQSLPGGQFQEEFLPLPLRKKLQNEREQHAAINTDAQGMLSTVLTDQSLIRIIQEYLPRPSLKLDIFCYLIFL